MSALWLNIVGLAAVGLGILFLAMLAAPLEALGWWAGWYKQVTDFELSEDDCSDTGRSYDSLSEESSQQGYVVFLDGIAKATPDNYRDVQKLLETLKAALPQHVFLAEVLPYSVSGLPLTEARPLAKFWRYARERKLKNSGDPLGFMINAHNLLQVLVSADKRYGPVFHCGEATRVIKALRSSGYQIGSGVPITLIGYSGGAQVAAGIAPYLKHVLRAPVDLISLGGVMSADEGVNDLRYVYHLAGKRDHVEKLGAALFPGRWAMVASSSWNRAKRRGKFTFIPMADMTHDGDGGYLDENSYLEHGLTYMQATAQTIEHILACPEDVHEKREVRGPLKYSYRPNYAG